MSVFCRPAGSEVRPCVFLTPHLQPLAARTRCTQSGSKSYAVMTVMGVVLTEPLRGPALLRRHLLIYTPTISLWGLLCRVPISQTWYRGLEPKSPRPVPRVGSSAAILLRHQREAEGPRPLETLLCGQHRPRAPGGQGLTGLVQPRPGTNHVLGPAGDPSALRGLLVCAQCCVPVPRVPPWPWGAHSPRDQPLEPDPGRDSARMEKPGQGARAGSVIL